METVEHSELLQMHHSVKHPRLLGLLPGVRSLPATSASLPLLLLQENFPGVEGVCLSLA